MREKVKKAYGIPLREAIYRLLEFQKEKGELKMYLKKMAENLPSLEKETDAQVQDTQDAKQDESKQTHTKTYQKLKRGF